MVVLRADACAPHSRRLPHFAQISNDLRDRTVACTSSTCEHLNVFENSNCVNECLSPACYAALYAAEPVSECGAVVRQWRRSSSGSLHGSCRDNCHVVDRRSLTEHACTYLGPRFAATADAPLLLHCAGLIRHPTRLRPRSSKTEKWTHGAPRCSRRVCGARPSSSFWTPSAKMEAPETPVVETDVTCRDRRLVRVSSHSVAASTRLQDNTNGMKLSWSAYFPSRPSGRPRTRP
jgi:hypothetical protein